MDRTVRSSASVDRKLVALAFVWSCIARVDWAALAAVALGRAMVKVRRADATEMVRWTANGGTLTAVATLMMSAV